MKALTAAEMRHVDIATSQRFGISSLQLMEAAGAAVAAVVRRVTKTGLGGFARRVCVLCGKGNNGGDGFVAVRHLKNDETVVQVYLFGEITEVRGDAAANLRRWTESGGRLSVVRDEASWSAAFREIAESEVIVDAMLGTGLNGGASGTILRAIEDINRWSDHARTARTALIVAVDTPSGLPSDGQAAEGPVLFAHHTVTFTAPKVGQLISKNCDAAGALEVVDIGSPRELVEEVGHGSLRWSEPEEFARLPLIRAVDSNKGMYGHVLVGAGSVGKSGAAILCGEAALRAGAGLVTIATPDPVLEVVASSCAELMTEPLASTQAGTISLRNADGDRFKHLSAGKSVLAVGPGLGQHPETQEFIRKIVLETKLPIVLDADGLNAFAGRIDALRECKTKFVAITPHPGEMARLLGTSIDVVQRARVKTAQDVARRCNAHVVLKGFHTVIAGPTGEVFINTNGNPGLAKGGSGDVLTGILAALTGQFKMDDWSRVLALGVYLHGAAADIAASLGSDASGLLANEVAKSVPKARLQLVQELQRRG
ncbi:MAG TPA: NAD(P)H-hydrate dehydratase [Candidatus Acidoferrum sp.]|jgi:NAD(P)H-hydrate epimerase